MGGGGLWLTELIRIPCDASSPTKPACMLFSAPFDMAYGTGVPMNAEPVRGVDAPCTMHHAPCTMHHVLRGGGGSIDTMDNIVIGPHTSVNSWQLAESAERSGRMMKGSILHSRFDVSCTARLLMDYSVSARDRAAFT